MSKSGLPAGRGSAFVAHQNINTSIWEQTVLDSAMTVNLEPMAHKPWAKLISPLHSDLMARGLDIEDCDAVINLELPSDAAHYAHRAGRTGRAGRYSSLQYLALSLLKM